MGARGGIVADGFSRVACEVDIAPESQKISFKEHACGKGLKSCRLTELGMTPRLCFDFCRQYANAKFFGLIHGRDCYCSVYFHAKTTGGGECNAVCEGDKKEMCGGMEKSSLFEMHMCADSASEAEMAADMSADALKVAKSVVELGTSTTDKLQALSKSWDLGVCSIKPEGELACALRTSWTEDANKIIGLKHDTEHDADVLTKDTKALTEAQEAVKAEGEKVTAKTSSAMELATDTVRDSAAKLSGQSAVMNTSITQTSGPFGGILPGDFSVFEPLGDVKKDWFAICALVPVPGESYAAVAEDDPKPCASRCLSLSTGTQACSAFNYQYKDGLATCQLLTSGGLVAPADEINMAIPIFEVSKTKRDAMGIKSMGCYAHGAFTAGHPKGPLGTKVVKEITV